MNSNTQAIIKKMRAIRRQEEIRMFNRPICIAHVERDKTKYTRKIKHKGAKEIE